MMFKSIIIGQQNQKVPKNLGFKEFNILNPRFFKLPNNLFLKPELMFPFAQSNT